MRKMLFFSNSCWPDFVAIHILSQTYWHIASQISQLILIIPTKLWSEFCASRIFWELRETTTKGIEDKGDIFTVHSWVGARWQDMNCRNNTWTDGGVIFNPLEVKEQTFFLVLGGVQWYVDLNLRDFGNIIIWIVRLCVNYLTHFYFIQNVPANFHYIRELIFD